MFELNDEEVENLSKVQKFHLEYGKRFKYKIQTLFGLMAIALMHRRTSLGNMQNFGDGDCRRIFR